jgi:UDPglucose--hexose-1-phosphate uridylyltransferase
MPEFRKDTLTGRWVIIATERAQRPQHRVVREAPIDIEDCPFCAGNESMTPPEILAYPAERSSRANAVWSVRVVANKFPALVDTDSSLDHPDHRDGLYESAYALGVHEVIIESPDHLENMTMLSERQLEIVLTAYRDRMLDLRSDKRWRYILIYKNQGVAAGATLPHIHSQLIALPNVPKTAIEEMAGAKVFYDTFGNCIFCETIKKERAHRLRIVTEESGFVAFCPYASRFPYETWILPTTHQARFDSGSKDFYRELARVLRETLMRLDRGLGTPPFNYVIHSNPVIEPDNDLYHCHIEIMPRLTQLAGFEWGSGLYINPVAPEDGARLLRQAVV